MARVFRADRGSLGKAERTPQGGIRVPATLTRTGVFSYATPRGTVREYRPPSEVGNAESLAMLRAAPLTLDHPPTRVDTQNYGSLAKGHVGDDVRMDGSHVLASLIVNDAQAIRAIEAGRREISCGYYCDTDDAPGIVPEGEQDAGQRYDRIQRNMKYNHVALVDDGRAGSSVGLRLDSAGDQETQTERRDMKTEIIDGVEYEVGSAQHAAAKNALKARNDAADQIRTLTAEREREKGRADAAEATLTETKERVKAQLTPDRMDAAVRTRARVTDKARVIMGAEYKTDGLPNKAIKLAVCQKAYPHLKLDANAHAEYVNGLWAGITTAETEAVKARNDAADKLIRETSPMPGAGGALRTDSNASGQRTPQQARNDAANEAEARGSRPLALSRRDKSKELSSRPMLQNSQLETMK